MSETCERCGRATPADCNLSARDCPPEWEHCHGSGCYRIGYGREKARADRADANAAAMRSAFTLDTFYACTEEACYYRNGRQGHVPKCGMSKAQKAALASDAGTALLAEVERLRKVEASAVALVAAQRDAQTAEDAYLAAACDDAEVDARELHRRSDEADETAGRALDALAEAVKGAGDAVK